MIPYIEQPAVRFGPLTIHAFGVIVAAAVLTGLELGRRRFRRLGLDNALGEGVAWWAVVGGFLGAHLFSVLFYFPRELAENPLVLLKFWEDISSFGGILGGLLGVWLYFRLKTPMRGAGERWAYVDAVAFVFPFALAIGRLACSLAHDHPGTLTTFPLAVSLQSEAARDYITQVYRGAGRLADLPPVSELSRLGFHDLGWYEFLFLIGLVVPTMLVLDRKPRPAGFFVVAFLGLYLPVRFALDFLRVSDARYAGLTPAQWVALVMLAALPALALRVERRRGAAHSTTTGTSESLAAPPPAQPG